jgi:hypothetical protein
VNESELSIHLFIQLSGSWARLTFLPVNNQVVVCKNVRRITFTQTLKIPLFAQVFVKDGDGIHKSLLSAPTLVKSTNLLVFCTCFHRLNGRNVSFN